MMTTFRKELIGEVIEVISSTNKSLEGTKGKVQEETKHTLRVENRGRVIRLLKNNITFRIDRTREVVDGKKLIKRPEDRIKAK